MGRKLVPKNMSGNPIPRKKGNPLLELQMRHFMQEVDNSLPYMYAAVAISLWECTDMEFDDIAYIFAHSQKIWQEYGENGNLRSLLDRCKELTGIELRRG